MTNVRSPYTLRALLALLLLTVISACGNAPAAPAADQNAVAPAAAANAPTAEQAAVPTAAPTADPRADWPEKFRVGYFGGDDAEELLRSNEPFRLYMEQKLGVPVELFTGTSYSAVIEAMRADRVDAMSVGPFSYILAVQEAGAEAIGVGVGTRAKPAVYDETIQPYYYSAIFTKKGSGIDSIEDLKGKDFNFVDPASTSGHLIPKTYLVNQGINPDEDMRTVFAGSHPTSVSAVWNDKSDAGAATITTLYNLAEEGQIEFCTFNEGLPNTPRTPEEIKARYDSCPDGSLVVLALSDKIPNTPFAIRSNLPESFKAAVKTALLDIKNDPALVETTARWYVDPAPELKLASLDQFYNSLRDVAKILDLDLKELVKQE